MEADNMSIRFISSTEYYITESRGQYEVRAKYPNTRHKPKLLLRCNLKSSADQIINILNCDKNYQSYSSYLDNQGELDDIKQEIGDDSNGNDELDELDELARKLRLNASTVEILVYLEARYGDIESTDIMESGDNQLTIVLRGISGSFFDKLTDEDKNIISKVLSYDQLIIKRSVLGFTLWSDTIYTHK